MLPLLQLSCRVLCKGGWVARFRVSALRRLRGEGSNSSESGA